MPILSNQYIKNQYRHLVCHGKKKNLMHKFNFFQLWDHGGPCYLSFGFEASLRVQGAYFLCLHRWKQAHTCWRSECNRLLPLSLPDKLTQLYYLTLHFCFLPLLYKLRPNSALHNIRKCKSGQGNAQSPWHRCLLTLSWTIFSWNTR